MILLLSHSPPSRLSSQLCQKRSHIWQRRDLKFSGEHIEADFNSSFIRRYSAPQPITKNPPSTITATSVATSERGTHCTTDRTGGYAKPGYGHSKALQTSKHSKSFAQSQHPTIASAAAVSDSLSPRSYKIFSLLGRTGCYHQVGKALAHR